MMNYYMMEEVKSRCDSLINLLEQDQEELASYLRGELMDEYRSLVEQEIQKLSEVKKMLSTMA